ncbi:MAG: hypothetical protein WCP21_21845, partial [Armatimonadota bacterium]
YARASALPLPDLALLCLTLFAFGFTASWLTSSPLSAAGLACGMLAAPALVWSLVVSGQLTSHWGPWLGFDYDSLGPGQQSFYTSLVFALFAAAALLAGLRALRRHPLLDLRKRSWATFKAFAGYSAAAIMFALLLIVVVLPRPVSSPVHEAISGPGGQRLALRAGPDRPDMAGNCDALWVLSVLGGQPTLVARGPVTKAAISPDGRHVVFMWGAGKTMMGLTSLWIADLDTGTLWRTPPTQWPSDQSDLREYWSPHGAHLLLWSSEGLMVIDGERVETVLSRRDTRQTQFVGWSPDETQIYQTSPARTTMPTRPDQKRRSADRPVWRVNLRSGQRTSVAQVPDDIDLQAVSPDGRWMVGHTTDWVFAKPPGAQSAMPSSPRGVDETALVDLRTGKLHLLHAMEPCKGGFSPEGRYLWCRYAPSDFNSHPFAQLRVVDLRTLQTVKTISGSPRDFITHDRARSELTSFQEPPDTCVFAPRGGRVYLSRGSNPDKMSGYERSFANADGSGFRGLPVLPGEDVGVAQNGELILRRSGDEFVTFDPVTGRQTPIWRPQ